jgi:3-oxoacid CoA-transferase
LAEKIRAGGAGIPAFYTTTGINTIYQKGQLKIICGENPKFLPAKETKHINGRECILEEGIRGDISILRAHQADKFGNLRFRLTSRNFNPLMAQASELTIVEVEEFVDQLLPDDIHLPGIYVDVMIQADLEKQFEKIKFLDHKLDETPQKLKIAQRVSEEFKEGMVVNLGIGLPDLAALFIKNMNIKLQSENGIIGMGPYPIKQTECDPDLINAGKETVTLAKEACILDSEQSFSMIRGGHMDLTVLGAMEVSSKGDLANWIIPDKNIKGMGGAMDLVSSHKTKVIVATLHVNKFGKPKIVDTCRLPLTGQSCVHKIVTDLAVFDVIPGFGLRLIQIAKGTSIDQIKEKTGCKFEISDNLLEPY